MKYHIPSTYQNDSRHSIVDAWVTHFKESNTSSVNIQETHLDFEEFLKREGASAVKGNFEEGWALKFEDESKYIWFLLKWS